MNKVSSIYILLFSIVLVVYSTVSLQLSSNSLIKIQKQNTNYLEIATRYISLQELWGDANTTQIKCKNILQSSNIQNAKITTSTTKMKINIRNENIKNLSKFMNKILNETIVILNFTLTKNSLVLELEI